MDPATKAELKANLVTEDLQLEPNSHRSSVVAQTKYDRNTFKGFVFWEFLGYFILDSFLGPLSYLLFIKFIRNGPVLARNLHVYGGKKEIFRIIIWLMKLYCYISTFVFPTTNLDKKSSYNSISQFWILIYTDVSLSVLYAAYYSSFTREEITKFKTEVYDPGDNIFQRLISLIRQDKTKFLDRVSLTASFPEIDPVNFYLVFPSSHSGEIPTELEPLALEEGAPQLKKYGIVDGLIVRGEKFATYIAEVAGYQHFDIKVTTIKVISRLLVFLRVILPLVTNIWNIFKYQQPFEELGKFIPFLLQQVFYSFLILRFVAVYDVLFLGLFMYYKKYNMLNKLWEVIKLKPNKDATQFTICTTVPQNSQTWLSVKRILSSASEQAFVVIDTNMSFVLLYTFFFLALYFVQGMDLLPGIFGPAQEFLINNPSFVILIALTVFVVIIVLVVDVVIGILINNLFVTEQGEWTLHKQVLGNISTKREMYSDGAFVQNLNPLQAHYRKISEIQEFLGQNYEEQFVEYLKRTRKSITLTIDGIIADENNNPHTLLGIPTTVPLVVGVSAIVSALGVTTLSSVFTTLTRDVTSNITG